MAGGRNHAPLEQLLDEIKFQRRQVVQLSKREGGWWHLLKAGKSWEASARTPASPSPTTRPTGQISLSGTFSSRSPIVVASYSHLAHVSLLFSTKRYCCRQLGFQHIFWPRRTQPSTAMTCSSLSGNVRQYIFSNRMIFQKKKCKNVSKKVCIESIKTYCNSVHMRLRRLSIINPNLFWHYTGFKQQKKLCTSFKVWGRSPPLPT